MYIPFLLIGKWKRQKMDTTGKFCVFTLILYISATEGVLSLKSKNLMESIEKFNGDNMPIKIDADHQVQP